MNQDQYQSYLQKQDEERNNFYMHYITPKGFTEEQYHYTHDLMDRVDGYLQSGITLSDWSVIEIKVRKDYATKFFNKSGVLLAKTKYEALIEKKRQIEITRGFTPNLYYFIFCTDALSIYKIEEKEYTWTTDKFQKNHLNPTVKEPEVVTYLFTPIETIPYEAQ